MSLSCCCVFVSRNAIHKLEYNTLLLKQIPLVKKYLISVCLEEVIVDKITVVRTKSSAPVFLACLYSTPGRAVSNELFLTARQQSLEKVKFSTLVTNVFTLFCVCVDSFLSLNALKSINLTNSVAHELKSVWGSLWLPYSLGFRSSVMVSNPNTFDCIFHLNPVKPKWENFISVLSLLCKTSCGKYFHWLRRWHFPHGLLQVH